MESEEGDGRARPPARPPGRHAAGRRRADIDGRRHGDTDNAWSAPRRLNVSNSGMDGAQNATTQKSSGVVSAKMHDQQGPLDVQERFARATAAMRAAAERHAGAALSDSSSDEEGDADAGRAIIENVMNSYSVSSEDKDDISRTIYFLEESLTTGSAACLICIGKIKIKDAIWNCSQCHTMVHLTCIQKWANDSIEAVTFRVEWDCPKCRMSYNKSLIPQRYQCFCTSTVDPPPHSWLLPHSCGNNCGKPLEPACGHRCVLLCHPGPCPPCPRFVPTSCFCGRGGSRSARCGRGRWSCGGACARALVCGAHRCARLCHDGACPPCELRVERRCVCGAASAGALCGAPAWHCDKVCGAPLPCGFHACTRACHAAGACEPCPYAGAATCACGAESAPARCPEPPPLCGGTCGRALPCGEHACPEKCHRGDCPPCAQVVTKRCRCGASERSVPCSRPFVCEAKCRERACARHACGRRCCVACPPCERPCGKTLSCGKHKCQSACHRGPCYPCPLQSKVSCRCGGSFYMVNCGRKRVKLPACNLPCQDKYKCGHSENNMHKCHFGECPPCKAKCEKPLPNCSHRCQAQCHESVKVVFSTTSAPATPVEMQSPKVKTMQLKCPPCAAAVPVPCLGGHEAAPQACHRARRAPCGRPCGAPLPCGWHDCARPCHLLAPDPLLPGLDMSCEACERECAAARPAHCEHRCPLGRCHAPPCPPCRRQVRVRCHCGGHAWPARCDELAPAAPTAAVPAAAGDALSCRLRCSKTKECGHRCSGICHPGPCGAGEDCTKLVKVFCPCKTHKEEMECKKARSGEMVVSCSALCEEKKKIALQQKEEESLKMQLLEEEKNRKELELFERKFKKGGKRKQKVDVTKVENNRNTKVWWAVAIIVLVIAMSVGFLWFQY